MAVAAQPPGAGSESPEALAANLGWLLSQASYALTTQLSAALEGVGITPRSYCVLATAMTGEYTQIALANAVGLDKTTMVGTVDALEEKGLVKRVPSAKDRRARVIAVTKAGEGKVSEAERIVEKTQTEVLSELPAGERKAFLDALAHLIGGPLGKPGACAQPVRRREPR
jgi:MarR family transcriptional regulator for hemolysin